MPAISVLRQASGFVETSPDRQGERDDEGKEEVEDEILSQAQDDRKEKSSLTLLYKRRELKESRLACPEPCPGLQFRVSNGFELERIRPLPAEYTDVYS
jgi:hypothetical protein